MSTIRKWAVKWNIPYSAVADLERELGIAPGEMEFHPNPANAPGTEARQQDLVRLEAARRGVRLFRNNVGALKDERGVPVRYGLANDNAQLNKVLKSSDLIGWTPTKIKPEHVGRKLAVFTAIEMKSEDWNFSGSPHEQAQMAFIRLVVGDGGIAKFSRGPHEL